MAGTVEKKLAELGITLPTPAAPVANYVPFVRTGNVLVISGQICFDNDGKLVAKGKLGGGVAAGATWPYVLAKPGRGDSR